MDEFSATADMKHLRSNFFADVFRSHAWRGLESASGQGSDTWATREVVAELPGLLQRLGVRSLLDIPCGDFHWMRDVALDGIDYIGADIVPELIEQNRANHMRPGVRFEVLDLVSDDLPPVDMVFVRDCFIHFTNALIDEALANIRRAGIRYLCLTHQTDQAANIDLDRAVAGVNHEYRPINFTLPPFSFPAPVDAIPDSVAGRFPDKIMGVWRMTA